MKVSPIKLFKFIFPDAITTSHIRVHRYYLTLTNLPLWNTKNQIECNKSKNVRISLLIRIPNLVFLPLSLSINIIFCIYINIYIHIEYIYIYTQNIYIYIYIYIYRFRYRTQIDRQIDRQINRYRFRQTWVKCIQGCK